MRWLTVTAWILVAAELLVLGFVAASGINHLGGGAVHAALLGLSLAVAVGASRPTGVRRETEQPPTVLTPLEMTPKSEETATDPLDNHPWLALVEECVQLLDEMDRDFAHADPERKEIADHVVLRLGEILQRAGVETIADEATFDRMRHQASKASQGMAVVQTVSPGYAIGRRVLRRAKVVVRPE